MEVAAARPVRAAYARLALLDRVRRRHRRGQLRRALLRRRRQRPRDATRQPLLVLDLRRRDDPLRHLARSRAPHLHRPLRPARAAAAAELGTRARARRRRDRRDLRLGDRRLELLPLPQSPGKEQGITNVHWEPAHAGAFAANVVLFAVVAPFVEELTFRGAGPVAAALPRPLRRRSSSSESRSASRTGSSRRCSSSSRSASRSRGCATAPTASCRGCSCTALFNAAALVAIVLR